MFTLFNVGRCGSTVLGNTLGQHPDIYWAAEIYYHWFSPGRKYLPWVGDPDIDARTITSLPGTSKGLLAQARAMGAEVARKRLTGFSFQPYSLLSLHMSAPAYVAEHREEITHWIFLRRRNLLRYLVSHRIAKQRGRWHHREGDPDAGGRPPVPKIHLNPENMAYRKHMHPEPVGIVPWLDGLLREWDESEAAMPPGSLHLVYEDDIERNPLTACTKVTEFLGASPLPANVHPKLSKILTAPLCDTIANFTEVADALRGTSYEKMLDA